MSLNTPRQEKAVLAMVSGAHGFSHYYIFSLPTILAFMVTDPALAHLELSFVKAGVVVSAFSIASGLFQFFVGVVADRVGAKPVLFGGLALLAASFALIGMAESYWMMLVFAFTAGAGNSVFHPADYTIMGANVAPPRLARAYAIHTFSGYLGFAVGPFVSGLLAGTYGWKVAFVAGGLGGLAMAALLLSQHARIKGQPARRPMGPATAASRLGRDVILAPPILMMFLFYMLSGGLSIGLNSAVAGSLHALWSIDLRAAAWAVSAFMAGGAVGTLVGGAVANRVKRLDTVAAAGYSVTGLMFCLIASIALPYAAILAAFCVGGFMFALITPSRDMLVRSLTPPGHSGKVFGFVSSGFEGGGILLAPGFGWLIDHGAPAFVFYAAATIMGLAFLAAVLATRLSRSRPVLQPAAAE